MLTGFDVSRYQTPGHYPPGKSFGIAKASEGLQHDPMYARHYAAMRKLGLVVGAYHFNFPTKFQSPEKQAERFLAIAANADLLFLDVESYSEAAGGGPGFTTAEADAFIRHIQRAGRRIGLYRSASGYPSDKVVHFNFRWVADYRLAARVLRRPIVREGLRLAQWTFWQYTSKGGPDGSPLDLDYFNGDAAALAALVKASHV